METIFSGTTTECLRHFKQAAQGNPIEVRKPIVKFTDVVDETVQRWLSEKMSPVGESLIRLRYYLEFLGYRVAELETLDISIRDAGRVYAFGLVSLTEIVEMIGLPKGTKGTSNLLATFRGARGISKERREQLKTLAELYQEPLGTKMQETEKVTLDGGVSTTASTTSPEYTVAMLSADKNPTLVSMPRDALLETLAQLVKAMIPLAHLISSDEFTPEERARVRELTGRDGVFTLANSLFRLCGERSRNMHPHQGIKTT